MKLSVASASRASRTTFDVEKIRGDFPILSREVHGKPLVYLDNAATTQKPRTVIETIERYYSRENSNIHRGVHTLSDLATNAYEEARKKVQTFLNAGDSREILFVRGATEGINLVSQSYGRKFIHKGDEIILSMLEHHSNIVPWQILCGQTGASLKVIPINDDGELLLDEFRRLLSPRTKFVSVTHVSNALGTVNPVKEIISLAHQWNVPVLIDGAQGLPHLKVDVRDLNCDFYVFSGHKIYGPTGIGAVYGRLEHLEAMDPYQGGGDMISSVTFEKTIYNSVPYKFEAGTPDISGAIGLGAALDYLNGINPEIASRHESDLLSVMTREISGIKGVKLLGKAKNKAGVLSFVMDGIHPHDVGTVLDMEGVAIRAGHHCAMPLMNRLGVPATCRASLALYNTREEIDVLARAVRKVREVFR